MRQFVEPYRIKHGLTDECIAEAQKQLIADAQALLSPQQGS